jgi:16S rRNA (cytosine1402-N4)-methyltransferase
MCGKEKTITILTKKPLIPAADEIEANPRSRSAKLRVAERI